MPQACQSGQGTRQIWPESLAGSEAQASERLKNDQHMDGYWADGRWMAVRSKEWMELVWW
ncbi:hypothetical protein LX36DRAFT_654359 [Colletotrichum falcatum]|nr:hypothetical protein LX36DRAFT_654359 [Colletotrichum falcatum]